MAPGGAEERVIVVGGGIAGLTAGFRLQQAGLSVLVLEAGDHVGGRMGTIEHRGFRIDTGAMMLSTHYSEMLDLIRDAGLTPEIEPTCGLIGYLRDGRVHRMRSTSLRDPFRSALLTNRDKRALVRMGFDLARWWRRLGTESLNRAVALDSESIDAYAERLGFSADAREYFLGPTAMSLSFGDAEELSRVGFLWALKRVFGGGFFSSPRGVGFLPAGLARRLEVRLGARAEEVVERGGGVEVSWAEADGAHSETAAGAVIALPARAVAAVYPQLAGGRAELLARVRYAPSMHVHFGLSQAPPEPAAMVYTSTRRHDGLGVTFYEHNKAPGRAAAGKGLLSTYWHERWSRQHWEDSDAGPLSLARDAVSRTFPGVLDHVEMELVTRVEDCVVINDPGLCQVQAQLDSSCDPQARVQLAGDYFSCSSTNTSLCLGERAARRLGATLNGK
jgi:protoporphyrinogen/coproporphyrinogen III oxidase